MNKYIGETDSDEVQAARYRKLRRYMSSNVSEGWEKVEHCGAIAACVDWKAMDEYLDSLPECTVGQCSVM